MNVVSLHIKSHLFCSQDEGVIGLAKSAQPSITNMRIFYLFFWSSNQSFSKRIPCPAPYVISCSHI